MEHIFRSYYTKSQEITDYMCKMLDFSASHKILEPSAGDGIHKEFRGVIGGK